MVSKELIRQRNKIASKKYKESHRQKVVECVLRYKQKHPDLYAYWSYKARTKRKSISFNISKHDFIDMIKKACFYCGDLDLINGLDRVNNKIGYEYGNVVTCCRICNRAKSDMSQSRFISMCKKVAGRFD